MHYLHDIICCGKGAHLKKKKKSSLCERITETQMSVSQRELLIGPRFRLP